MVDITGKRYGKLIALEFVEHRMSIGNRPVKKEVWRFKCDCGKTKKLEKKSVMSGHTKSCGHLRELFMKKQSYKNFKKNLTNARLSTMVPMPE